MGWRPGSVGAACVPGLSHVARGGGPIRLRSDASFALDWASGKCLVAASGPVELARIQSV